MRAADAAARPADEAEPPATLPVRRWRALRLAQIRALASLLSSVGRVSRGGALLCRARQRRLVAAGLNRLLGFRRDFATLADAQAAATRYIPFAHDHPAETALFLTLADMTRESDYPVLFILAPLAGRLRRVFDLGGAVGNLLYSYDRHLHFRDDLTWTVMDLAPRRTAGLAFAQKRQEPRIRFVDSFEDAAGADLLIVSGALHYFEEPLYPMLQGLARLPDHVIVNRSPFSNGHALCTVQDARTHLVACKLHDRADFIGGMERLGYRLRAQWPVFELRAWVPLYPDLSAAHYWGFYFALADHAGPPAAQPSAAGSFPASSPMPVVTNPSWKR